MKRAWSGAAAVACVAALVGCASSVPAPVLLSLPHAGAAATAAAPSSAQPLLVVRRVGIPEYMSSRRVRYRADASTLAEWPNTFWAERIEIGVTREFVAALRERLPGWTICEASCEDRGATLSLQLDLAPLDYLRSTQQLQAGAGLVVTGGAGAGDLRLRQSREQSFSVKGASDTPQAEAEAMTQLLREVAAIAAPAVTAARPLGRRFLRAPEWSIGRVAERR